MKRVNINDVHKPGVAISKSDISFKDGVPTSITSFRGVHETISFVNKIGNWGDYVRDIKRQIKLESPKEKVNMKIVGSIRLA